jgi:hypothetical protein
MISGPFQPAIGFISVRIADAFAGWKTGLEGF